MHKIFKVKERQPSKPIAASIDRFLSWLDKVGIPSYDPYDIWGTKYGLWARRIYYKKGKIGLPLVAPILLIDLIFPAARKLFAKKQRYATADAQLILGFLNLHETRGDVSFLKRAISLADEMLEYSIPGYKGHCWGYPFDWQNNKALWRKNTPYITCTPYCYEAYVKLFEITKEDRYLEIARSIARFVREDLKDTPYSDDAVAGSYSPIDNSMIPNASAYRAFVLIDAGHRFKIEDYTLTGIKNLNFLLQCQNDDGSWLYGLDTPADNFIDHFHTCFVLKNLLKLNRTLNREDIRKSIGKGYDYYREFLFTEDDLPKFFAKEPRTQFAKLEMYNFAEAITLGCLIKDEQTEAFTHAQSLSAYLTNKHQLKAGYFSTRTYALGFRHTFPFLRWPQAQIFLSLTNLELAKISEPKTKGD